MSPEELWASKYAARFAEERAREESHREEAFLNITQTVCGEELRMMNPQDFLILNGIQSPFVCALEPDAADVVIFLWHLNALNDGSHSWFNERRRKKMLRRVAVLDFEKAVNDCRAFVDKAFQDAPRARERSGDSISKPIGTCFLVPLIMRIAKETGWSKDAIMTTPLPQLFQFIKHLQAEALGKEFIDYAPSDRITGEFLNDLNGCLARN